MRCYYECTLCYNSMSPHTLLALNINIKYSGHSSAPLLIHHEIGRPHGLVSVHNEFIVVKASSDLSKHLVRPAVVSLQVTET